MPAPPDACGLPPQAGSVVAGYRLLRRLGQGAHGTVFLVAPLAAEGRPGLRPLPALALKLLALPEDPHSLAAQAFLRSAAAARRLLHPGIVRVHGAGFEAFDGAGAGRHDNAGGLGWLLMEAVPGCDLLRYTEPARLLPEPVVLHVVERLARALDHAHRQGVVHRDVKPANVLVDWASDTVKLADFGLARAADALQTESGVVPGSPAYMAPELLAGALPTPQTDLYALGALLFQLLCGRLPHAAGSMGEWLRRVADDAAPDLRAFRPQLPLAWAETVAGLLARQPAQRPRDALQAAQQLAALR